MLKQNIEEYAERQKLLASIETLDGNIAFTKATPYTQYRREDLAKYNVLNNVNIGDKLIIPNEKNK